ncbi:MAG: glycosyltransferase family 4 protein [Conexivisphaerales archaeon]
MFKPKDVIVAYPTLNFLGGSVRVCIATINALKLKGYKVTLATVDKTNWFSIEKVFGKQCRPNFEFYFVPKIPFSRLTFRQAFIALVYLFEILFLSLIRKRSLLLNMGGEVVDSVGDVIYVNALPLKLMSVIPQIRPGRGAQWRCYGKLYALLLKLFRFGENVLIANSMFNQFIIKKYLNKNSLMVYPPIGKVNCHKRFHKLKKRNVVVSVARFRRAKGVEIIPEIAKNVKNCDFLLIGAVDSSSHRYVDEIIRKAEELGVHERIKVFLNVPFNEVVKKLRSAKIYLHTQALEAFGIAVIEAMAAGCVPVIPRCGGPWFDILDCKQGVYGFSYLNTLEAADIINKLLKDNFLFQEMSLRASKRALKFISTDFENKLIRVVERVYRLKLRCI